MKKRFYAFVAIFFVYVAAAALGVFVFKIVPGATLLRLLAADLAATVFVWLWGVILRNSSVYDPYWSVAPPVIVIGLMYYYRAWGLGNILLLAVIVLWSVRLTGNWAYTFRGMKHQDWRYDKFKNENRRFWFFINLFGINVMPTIVVYLALIPAALFVAASPDFNVFRALVLIIPLAATAIEFVSDLQLRRFRKTAAPGAVMDRGLWRYSRHPNYFGEIIMWWGVYFYALAGGVGPWYLFACPVANTLLFLFISIPLMERRLLATRPAYRAYRERTSALLFWPPRKL